MSIIPDNPRVFADIAGPLVRHARLPAKDLLPIIPVGAKLGPTTKVDPSQCGKVPGFYRREEGVWVGLPGTWAAEGLNPTLQRSVGTWPTTNVGLRTADFPALDIDVQSDSVRRMIEERADIVFGTTAVRERAGSTRALWLFRRAGDEPIRKMKLAFQMEGQEHSVEFLGLGQQCVIFGTHPSGRPYEWREGCSLMHLTADSLVPVTATEMRAFFDVIAEVIREAGGVIGTVHRGGVGGSEGHVVAEIEPSAPADIALDALWAIPNDDIHVPTREKFLAVLASFKAALGRTAEDHRAGAEAWAVEHAWATTAYFDKVWNSLDRVKVGPDYLFREARKLGWKGSAKLDFEGLSEAEAEAIIASAQSEQEEAAQALQTTARQLVYWEEGCTWIAWGSGEEFSLTSLNYSRIGLGIAQAGASGLATASAKLANSGLVRAVKGRTYMPGKPKLFEYEWEGRRGLWYNTWNPSFAVIKPGIGTAEDAQPWLDHVAWLLPDEGERRTLLQWMAHVVTQPGVKVRWAPVIIGAQGIGKDLMFAPVRHGIGGHNFAEIAPKTLVEKWTFFYEKQLVVVEEMQRLDKMEVYEQIKAVITGTGADTLWVEHKHKQPYQVPNLVNFAFLTNHSNAISLAPDDRRFFVVQCAPEEKQGNDYYQALGRWYRNGGLEAVVRYLRGVDLSDFQPDTVPGWTEAKRAMLEETLPPFPRWLTEQFEKGGRLEGRTVITTAEVRDLALHDHAVPSKVRDALTDYQLYLGFKVAGWRQSKPMKMSNGRSGRVYVRDAGLLGLPAATLRARLKTERKQGQEFALVESDEGDTDATEQHASVDG